MRDKITSTLARARDTFSTFTTGQKAVAIVGTAALLIAAVMVFRWASTPSYAPLYSDLSGADASAVIEELEAQGIPYEIAGGGGTVMVPRSEVYETRIALSGQGLPASSDGGYSILDEQGLSTSEFKETTDFKRAMEGELATAIETIEGVETAVVTLAIPEKEVFADEQEPAKASVLIDAAHGTTLGDEQVQAIVHHVSYGVDGLDAKNVTVSDTTGAVLTQPGDESGSGISGERSEQVQEFQDAMQADIQAVLDRVLGPGNSTSTVTADLDFDKAVIESREYTVNEDVPPLSESNSSETYNGPAGSGANPGGTVGPDGQMDPGAGTTGEGAYENTTETRDNPVNETVEHRETAPGSVNSIHAGVVLDETAAAAIDPDQVEDWLRAAVGFDRERGDTYDVTVMPFDRSAEEAAAAEIAAAKAEDAAAAEKRMWRNVAIGAGIALMVLLAWFQSRRRARARQEATTYIVEQLRADQAARTPIEAPAPAVAALEAVEEAEDDKVRDDLLALVEKQPEDVAALLRGWLVDPK
ncbi:flagellar M-ring protein FliF [Nocardioides thalensis]|uniref:Flagellar M-ring protein n=1 Tax=Nocardioides thalensis TaxID=1914755 RepID=A0A853BVE5_9ACTN|nr:flagellar basal-body MS-ring/collar protein FliF [Nocardioides thalensis]NYI99829.1 flagellar M-ring protein FliF [Nocardioides thalensis]